jgi:HPt (histidine-containing phosphotransfer) domain-containing protein
MTPDAAAETAALIADLWQRHLPTLLERLDILDRIAASASQDPITKKDREEGIAISHKFAGSLGMYGYSHGTEVASQMEQLLRSETLLDPALFAGLTIELRETIFPKAQ